MANDSTFSRRAFLSGLGMLGVSTLAGKTASANPLTGVTADYKAPYPRQEPITPPGSQSHSRFRRLCTGCQLCVQACPNKVLSSAFSSGTSLAQPALSYERGYCRPDCNKCSQVCPTQAISPFDCSVKSSTQIGYAVFDLQSCVVISDGVNCGLCARRCPAGAISRVPTEHNGKKVLIPAIDTSRCLGCGACEHYCPSRPKSAIHVEGVQIHKSI